MLYDDLVFPSSNRIGFTRMTAYHAKYFPHKLTRRCPSASGGKLAASLADAQVDLNPRQIDATPRCPMALSEPGGGAPYPHQ